MEIQNIWAIGRNYRDHAKELNNPTPTTPVVFLKAGSCVVPPESTIKLPSWSKNIHHEVEIALQFDQKLQIHAFAIALDLTARDVQEELKQKSLPWTLAKSFPQACPLGPWIKLSTPLESLNLQFLLKVNGELRQQGMTKDMIFSPTELVYFVQNHFPVLPGDVILTGTPAGVAQVKSHDILHAEIIGNPQVQWKIG